VTHGLNRDPDLSIHYPKDGWRTIAFLGKTHDLIGDAKTPSHGPQRRPYGRDRREERTEALFVRATIVSYPHLNKEGFQRISVPLNLVGEVFENLLHPDRRHLECLFKGRCGLRTRSGDARPPGDQFAPSIINLAIRGPELLYRFVANQVRKFDQRRQRAKVLRQLTRLSGTPGL
jgi:hypothetical protein